MYITVKKTNQITNPSVNVVDALFSGTTVTELEPIGLQRTVTLNREESITNHVSYEMFMMAARMIQQRAERHENPEEEYITFRIPKKTHGFREINAPKEELKADQKEIESVLTNYLGILTHDSAWAYVKHRDVVHAMHEHTNNNSRWYLKLDLHDFFGSCSPAFIKEQLLKIYPFAEYKNFEQCNTLIDNLIKIAVKDNGLPQGTPLSPTLTNLIMVEFDYKINRLLYQLTKDNNLIQQKYIYTRYADDIIISARNKFDYTIVVNAIKELFEGTPLQLNEEKTRFASNSGRNWNLGVMCNNKNETTIGYRRKQQLKSIIHNYLTDRENGNTWTLDDLYWLQGQLSWLYNVEPEYSKGFIGYINNKYNTNLLSNIRLDIKNN